VNESGEVRYLSYEQVVAYHIGLMRRLGEGYYGVLDPNLLASALDRPRMAAQYEDADIFRQAAHLIWGLLKNHPFHQGNKRTAVALVISFLDVNGYWIKATQEEAIDLGYHIEDGGWDVDRVEVWLRDHAVPREGRAPE
jgi:death on curing protein